jgi:hypothetical protein
MEFFGQKPRFLAIARIAGDRGPGIRSMQLIDSQGLSRCALPGCRWPILCRYGSEPHRLTWKVKGIGT